MEMELENLSESKSLVREKKRKTLSKHKKITKITFGTKEWSDYSLNFVTGCSHDCRYCYAKKMSLRFGRKTQKNWKEMEVREEVVGKGFTKKKGRYMFPTSHDITPEKGIFGNTIKILTHLLKAGNSVLITTKPHFEVIKKICDEFEESRENIQFRFTITSNNNNLLEFWEPGAPKFEERLRALTYAFETSYKTSISIEPFLSNPTKFIKILAPYVTESIWVGPMNYIQRNGLKKTEINQYAKIRKLVKPACLFKIYNELNRLKIEKLRFKDAFIIKIYNANLISQDTLEDYVKI